MMVHTGKTKAEETKTNENKDLKTEHKPRVRKTKTKFSYRIEEAGLHHGRGVYEAVCLANAYDPGGHVSGIFGLKEWRRLLSRFPGGQLVAVAIVGGREKVVGVALSLRTSHAPSAKPLSWYEAIGDLTLANHDPEGSWLYGVEKAVHPDFQGLGIGSALYKAQFALVEKEGLKGILAGGMLKGYARFKHQMSVYDYAERVVRGEIFDPTVSVQMRRGFKPCGIIENYAWDAQAEHTGMLIVWEPPKVSLPKTLSTKPRAPKPLSGKLAPKPRAQRPRL